MENHKIDYLRWRWKQYNGLGQFSGLYDVYHKRFKENNKFYFSQIPDKLLIEFKNEDFNVSNELIEQYDQTIIESDYKRIREGKFIGSPHSIRSDFIENCFFDIQDLSDVELLKKIIENFKTFLWWDILSLDEVILSIVKIHFLKSTRKLIGIDSCATFLREGYQSKNELCESLFQEFNPPQIILERMFWDDPSNKYDYGFLFRNELKRCVRIIENECRISNNEKIIGAFFNEDLLFRELFRTFGNKYKVISQGSPEWLSPQRFDIFFPGLNIAVEYQGEQHFRPVDFGGKGMKVAKKQYQENVKRDSLKKEKADKNDCSIFYVLPDYDLKKVKQDIKVEIHRRILI